MAEEERPPCWVLIEWDMDNGEVLDRLYYKTEEEAWKAMEEFVKEAQAEGIECDYYGSGYYVCTGLDEDGYPWTHQLVVEPEWDPRKCSD